MPVTHRLATREELQFEKFLRDRESTLAWKTSKGEWIPLARLDNNHLTNIINMLDREYAEMHYDDL